MLTAFMVSAFVALGALGTTAWVLVQLFRVLKPILQSFAEFYERLARFDTVVKYEVDKRVTIINEAKKRVQNFQTKPQANIPPEAPLPDDIGPNVLDEQRERERDDDSAYEGEHPRRESGISYE